MWTRPSHSLGFGSKVGIGCGGQLASPLPSVWIFAHILKVLQAVQWQVSQVDPKLMLMAYRAWILARRRLLFRDLVRFPASETLACSERFESVRALPMTRLLQVFKDVTIQTVWEASTKASFVCIDPSHVIEGGSIDVTSGSEYPTTTAVPSEDESGETLDLGLSVSQVAIDEVETIESNDQLPFEIFLATVDGPPVPIKVSGQSTVKNLQQAERCFQGEKRKACTLFKDGQELTRGNQFLQPGAIYLSDFSKDATEPQDAVSAEILRELSKLPPDVTEESPGIEAPPCHTPHDECVIEDQPLANLGGQNFLRIHPPIVGTYDHAVSLLAQGCEVQVRCQALANQGSVWGDDEVRWHLARLQAAVGSSYNVISIDPLLIHGALSSSSFKAVGQFLQQVHQYEAVYISVVNQQQHWYPIILQCKENGLQVTTWDHPNASHVGLHSFCQQFARHVGLQLCPLYQLERRFSGPKFCGSLGIAFLEHRILGTGLPETFQPAEAHHNFLRKLFREALTEATTTWQPWIWGNGVNEPPAEEAVKSLTPLLVSHSVPSEHAHHRAQQAVKAIGPSQVQQALGGKAPWKSLKTPWQQYQVSVHNRRRTTEADCQSFGPRSGG